MKAKLIILFLFFGVMLPIEAQHKRSNESSDKIRNKIEELEKVKLMEVLDLKEEDMLKFFSRRKEFLQKNSELEENKNKLIDKMKEELDNLDDQKCKSMIDEVNAIDESIIKNKHDFILSLKDILPSKQIVKYIIFERNFRKELKEMLLKKRNK